MNNGCPEIPGEAAHQLIREWEEQQLQTKEKHIRFGLRKIMAEEMTTEEARVWLRECLRTGELNSETLAAWIGNQFPTFPAEWVGSVLPVETPDQDQIPWNRRVRRAHSQAKGGNLVNLFSGATNWSKRPNVIDVELDRGQDLRNDALYSYLLELAKARKVSGVVGGPRAVRGPGLGFEEAKTVMAGHDKSAAATVPSFGVGTASPPRRKHCVKMMLFFSCGCLSSTLSRRHRLIFTSSRQGSSRQPCLC